MKVPCFLKKYAKNSYFDLFFFNFAKNTVAYDIKKTKDIR